MTPTPITTREAVEQALYALAFRHDIALGSTKREETFVAAQLLCELYGFKLEQFFSAEGAKEN